MRVGAREMVLMNPFAGQEKRHRGQRQRLADPAGAGGVEEEGGPH